MPSSDEDNQKSLTNSTSNTVSVLGFGFDNIKRCAKRFLICSTSSPSPRPSELWKLSLNLKTQPRDWFMQDGDWFLMYNSRRSNWNFQATRFYDNTTFIYVQIIHCPCILPLWGSCGLQTHLTGDTWIRDFFDQISLFGLVVWDHLPDGVEKITQKCFPSKFS